MFHDDHQSGKFKATSGQRRAANYQIALTCSVAALTEQSGMPFLINGWRHHGDETRIVWNTEKWHCLGFGESAIRTVRYKRGTDTRTSVPVTWVALERRQGGLVLVRFAGHPPAHLFNRAQRAANRQFFRGLESKIAPVAKHYRPDEVTGSFDLNRHLGLERNRELVQDSVDGLGLDLLVPPRPTRGLRKIDGFVTNARGGLSMLDRVTGYDHRGIRRVSLTEGRHR